MTAAARVPLLAGVLLATAVDLHAQVTTLADVLASLERAAGVAQLRTAEPIAAARLDSASRALREADAGRLTIDQVADAITRNRAGFGTVARWDPRMEQLLAQPWFRGALLTLPLVANGSVAPLLEERGVPRDSIRGLLAPTDELGRRVGERALASNQEKLRRYEIKYGPDSPRLNAVEVGLNYAGQLWLPFLQPSADGWPSRFEIIAAYRTAELTAFRGADDDLEGHVVSAGQLGVRWYHFGERWGAGNRLQRVLRPRYGSAGAYVMGPRDLPLQRPWAKGNRPGLFIGWGGFHVAYVFESPRRFVIGTGTQLIPYVF